MKAESKLLKMRRDKEVLMSTGTLEMQKRLPPFAIVEFPPLSKKMTLLDRSFICEKNSQPQKLFKISDLGSILKERDLDPYWSEFHEEKSSRLWLPTKIVLQDLDLKSSNGCSKKMVENSWFSTELITAPKENLQKIFSPSFMSFLAECTDCDVTFQKSKKIRIYPTKEQQLILKQWIGTARFTYNKTIEYLNAPQTKASWKTIKGKILVELPIWSKKTPYQIKSIAVRDACLAVSSAKRKFKQTGKFNEVKFRSRKIPVQSCYIPKSAVSKNGIYYTLANGPLQFSESLPDNFGDCRLVYERGRWFLATPVEQKQHKFDNQGRVVSLDPGIRSFQTFFFEAGCGKLGVGDFGKIQRLCACLDKLISKKKLEQRRFCKRNVGKATSRLRNKIRDLIDELHHKVALFLVKNFDVILLPTFETSQMVIKKARKLRSKSVRSMLSFAHYRFKQFLKHKAFEHGKLVLDQNEAWTSKTVSWTGEIDNNLGGSKIIRSKKTNLEMDRDYNGARGIFLRALGDQPILRDNLENTSASNGTLVAFGSEK